MKKNKIEELLDFLKDEPGDSFIQYALALEYWKEGEKNNALSYFENIIHTDPNYLAVYYQLGKLLEELSRSDDASIVYQKGIEKAKEQNKRHTLSELQGAYNLLIGEEDEY